MTTIQEVLAFLNRFAPFETAEEWDNVGLLIGDGRDTVQRLMVTLDITVSAVDQAVRQGVSLIVSHHPVIFEPLYCLPSGSVPYLLARHGIAAICLHSNLDRAAGGVNDELAAALGLRDVRPAPDGLSRIGRLAQPLSPDALARMTACVLGGAVRVGGADVHTPISRVAVCGGAGAKELLALTDVDAAVVGECKHHEWLAAGQQGRCFVEAGHYATENVVIGPLCARLRDAFPSLEVTAFAGECPYETVWPKR